MTGKDNFFEDCFDPQSQMSVEQFTSTFCKHCRNVNCERAENMANDWEHRMATNVDRLLENPQFSELRSPKHLKIHQLDFQDISRRAMKLVLSSQRNDWKPISDAEIGIVPDNRSEASPEATKTVEDAVSKLSEMTGKKPKPDVSVEQEEPPEPMVELSASELRRLRKLEEGSNFNQVPASNPPKPEPIPQGALPRRMNTPMPPAGIMIDGSEPPRRTPGELKSPKVDPWAPVTERKLSPGAKIVIGGGDGKT